MSEPYFTKNGRTFVLHLGEEIEVEPFGTLPVVGDLVFCANLSDRIAKVVLIDTAPHHIVVLDDAEFLSMLYFYYTPGATQDFYNYVVCRTARNEPSQTPAEIEAALRKRADDMRRAKWT